MGMFDGLIQEAANRFKLGPQAAALLRELLALMSNERSGGVAGFLDRFRNAGLGDMVQSWLGRGTPQAIDPDQLTTALGKDVLGGVARKVGISEGAARPALAFMVPKVIKMLAPDGKIPAALPADAQAFLAAAGPRAAARSSVPAGAGAPGSIATKWWLWALVIAFAVGSWLFHSLYDRPQTPQATAPVVAPVAAVPSRLAVSNLGVGVQVSGIVKDEPTRASIFAALGELFGVDRVDGSIDINPNADAPAWLAKLREGLGVFNIPGGDLIFDGNKISVGGFLSDEDRQSLLDRLRAIFGAGFSYGFLGDKSAELYQTAKERTLAGLAALPPSYSGADLVQVLNLSIIKFATGSADVAPENDDLIEQAAHYMKGLPAGTVIEIGGHTDDTGDRAANMALSQARAEAVRQELIKRNVNPAMLETRGYGPDRPIASNETPMGRFQNRRIEYGVVR